MPNNALQHETTGAERLRQIVSILNKYNVIKGMTPEKAAQLVEDPLFLGCLMIKSGDADGEIAGARNTTGNVLRPALQIIRTAPGMKCVSGAFLMFVKEIV